MAEVADNSQATTTKTRSIVLFILAVVALFIVFQLFKAQFGERVYLYSLLVTMILITAAAGLRASRR